MAIKASNINEYKKLEQIDGSFEWVHSLIVGLSVYQKTWQKMYDEMESGDEIANDPEFCKTRLIHVLHNLASIGIINAENNKEEWD